MPRARPSGFLLAGLVGAACARADAPSERLRAGSSASADAPPAAAPKDGSEAAERPEAPSSGSAPSKAADAKAADPLVLRGEPPPKDAPRATLRLALEPGMRLVVQTVGNVRYPMVTSQVAYAIEEIVEVEACHGAKEARTCTLARRLEAVEAEGRAGRFIRTEQEKLLGHVIRGSIDTTGRRASLTTLEGPRAADLLAADPDFERLHPFYCLRFPEEPVAVGAKWNHTCFVRDRDRVAERRVLWEVSAIEPDPDGDGQRVELRFVGSYAEPDADGRREGTVQGIVYFPTAHGLPHVIREKLAVAVAADKGLRTEATANRTFGRIAGRNGKEVRTLVDGRPFPPGINVAAPADAPKKSR